MGKPKKRPPSQGEWKAIAQSVVAALNLFWAEKAEASVFPHVYLKGGAVKGANRYCDTDLGKQVFDCIVKAAKAGATALDVIAAHTIADEGEAGGGGGEG